jgi:hypothetical protein
MLADAAPAALLHEHLVAQRQVERQLHVGDARQLLRLVRRPASAP